MPVFRQAEQMVCGVKARGRAPATQASISELEKEVAAVREGFIISAER